MSEARVRQCLHWDMFIDGKDDPGSSRVTMPVVNPYVGEAWATVSTASEADVDRTVRAARASAPAWGRMPAQRRGVLLRALAEQFRANVERLAILECRCNGKLLGEARSGVLLFARSLEYFAGIAETITGETIPLDKPDAFDFTVREPYGVIAAIIPWNSPLLLLAYKAVPALAAGNAVVVKPSEQTPLTAIEFARLAASVGFPQGVVNVVAGAGDVGAALVSHPGVDKVSFTGGTETGRAIMRAAATNITPVALELGGKSPNMVFADSELDKALTGVARGIFSAAGQSCRAGSRLLIEQTIANPFVEQLVEIANALKLGDPMDPATQMGPIISARQLDHIDNLVQSAVAEGAKVLAGGKRVTGPNGTSQFYAPTVLDGLTTKMRVAQEEVFGPVLSVFRFDDEEECLAIANDTKFGLGAGLWTSNINRVLRMARRIQSGTMFVNTYREASPLVPFGGYKQSGFGRENGVEALRENTKIKNVWINFSDEPPGNPFVL